MLQQIFFDSLIWISVFFLVLLFEVVARESAKEPPQIEGPESRAHTKADSMDPYLASVKILEMTKSVSGETVSVEQKLEQLDQLAKDHGIVLKPSDIGIFS